MFSVVSVMLAVIAVIHLLPLSGVRGGERLAALYGLDFAEPNLVILMRHRAVLFGLLGLFFLYAAFVPSLQPIALSAGTVSVVSFLWIARSVGGYNVSIGRIVTADRVALVCLLVAGVVYVWTEW